MRISVVKCSTWAKRFFTCERAERNELVKAVAGGRWYSMGRLLVFFPSWIASKSTSDPEQQSRLQGSFTSLFTPLSEKK